MAYTIRSCRNLSTLVALSVFLLLALRFSLQDDKSRFNLLPVKSNVDDSTLQDVARISEEYYTTPITAPYKGQFWEAGQRARRIKEWLDLVAKTPQKSKERIILTRAIERLATSLFPFLPPSPHDTPLIDLMNRAEKGTKGIVMPVGGSENNIRFAGHLIASLREVLGCQLPIEITYAGDDDLPLHHRERLASIDQTGRTSFTDIWSVFDDGHLSLGTDGWSIKPFAALASRFEQVILVDCDSVFLQDPEALFRQQPFIDTGAYLFHDRLLWQHKFSSRHDWWRDQIKEPSAAMNKSLVWTEEYAEECDSGVVVLDKSRVDAFMGLLHTSWQNMYDVRNEVTYKIMYGDKESWWLGLELAGSPYEFEQHYGSMVGWESPSSDDKNGDKTPKVCSFVIAHTDTDGKLIWYNGGLLKNKLADPDSYEAPEAWMFDGKWEKGAKKEFSCMVGGNLQKLTEGEVSILQGNIKEAIRVDKVIRAPVSQP